MMQPDNTMQASNLARIKGGNQFIELGLWRIGIYDYHHFCFTHKSGYTSVIYRSDGTIHPGPRTDFNLWEKPSANVENVVFGENYIEFGGIWRLGQINPQHLSLSNLSGKTCMIWRSDGTKHPGPRTDFSGWELNGDQARNLSYEDKVLSIGYWKIGECDNSHMSIGTTITCDIYRKDGTVHSGPRFDFNLCKQ